MKTIKQKEGIVFKTYMFSLLDLTLYTQLASTGLLALPNLRIMERMAKWIALSNI